MEINPAVMGVHTYRGKLGQLTPWKNGKKIKKRKHAKKSRFLTQIFIIFFALGGKGALTP